MPQLRILIKLAAVTSSLFFVSGYVSYRAGMWRTLLTVDARAATSSQPGNDSTEPMATESERDGIEFNSPLRRSAEATYEEQFRARALASGSKSGVIHVPPPPLDKLLTIWNDGLFNDLGSVVEHAVRPRDESSVPPSLESIATEIASHSMMVGSKSAMIDWSPWLHVRFGDRAPQVPTIQPHTPKSTQVLDLISGPEPFRTSGVNLNPPSINVIDARVDVDVVPWKVIDPHGASPIHSLVGESILTRQRAPTIYREPEELIWSSKSAGGIVRPAEASQFLNPALFSH